MVVVVISELSDRLVRMEVTDEGALTVPCPRTPDEDDCRGRGLLLVEEMSVRWGFNPGVPGGNVVWAEVLTAEDASDVALPAWIGVDRRAGGVITRGDVLSGARPAVAGGREPARAVSGAETLRGRIAGRVTPVLLERTPGFTIEHVLDRAAADREDGAGRIETLVGTGAWAMFAHESGGRGRS